MTEKKPRPPRGLKEPGRAFWRSVVDDFVPDERELATLLQVCRTLDMLEDLQDLVDREGLMDSTGKRPHPAVMELRLQRIAFARLMTALRIPTQEDEKSKGRTQRRGGPRGVYPIRPEAAS
ncbi:MAG: terminase [Paenarthrobacter ureafaciens]|uniref:terminase n=1 Tax=Paenarthrobacter ureafaciens TaxID=37931 RepID=UPI001AC31176|nr:terminase [Paenarthrobacter ureafaciens]MBN9128497.1 terminase [Paenarthrobacter ureafaciens]